MSGPTNQEIMDAIKASGYLMEQNVATVLEKLGFTVQTNVPFQDPDEQKSREVDVLSTKEIYANDEYRIQVGVELICECKNSASPFVFIGRAKNSYDYLHIPSEYIFPTNDYTLERINEAGNLESRVPVSAFEYFELSKRHYYFQHGQKAVQFCKLLRQDTSKKQTNRTGNKWQAGHFEIYNSIVYPIIKATGYRQAQLFELLRHPTNSWKFIALYFPIVVVNNSLFYVDGMEENPNPQSVSHVTLIRDLTDQHISGRFLVDFVTLSGLEQFVRSSITPFYSYITDLVASKPKLFRPDGR